MNKRQKQIYERYLQSENIWLFHVYNTCSREKALAYDNCEAKCKALNGYRFRIISYNVNMFTIGFMYELNGKKYFHYETHVKEEEWRID